MLREESIWINKVLKELDLSDIRKVLDVGSSTKEFRTRTQSYIDENVFRPLRERNIAIQYMDKKIGEGVDLVYDIENVSADMIGVKFDVVLCSNLMEHVKDPAELALLLIDLVNPGGFLLVTVPQCYRYHEDPIDTMYRPSLHELIRMFSQLTVVNQATIRVRDFEKYKYSEYVRYLIPFLNWKVNCLLLKKSLG